MNLERKQIGRQWYGGILSYATVSLLIDFQTKEDMHFGA
jgi:hypothetical protein